MPAVRSRSLATGNEGDVAGHEGEDAGRGAGDHARGERQEWRPPLLKAMLDDVGDQPGHPPGSRSRWISSVSSAYEDGPICLRCTTPSRPMKNVSGTP